jgi:hypothetical protein
MKFMIKELALLLVILATICIISDAQISLQKGDKILFVAGPEGAAEGYLGTVINASYFADQNDTRSTYLGELLVVNVTQNIFPGLNLRTDPHYGSKLNNYTPGRIMSFPWNQVVSVSKFEKMFTSDPYHTPMNHPVS